MPPGTTPPGEIPTPPDAHADDEDLTPPDVDADGTDSDATPDPDVTVTESDMAPAAEDAEEEPTGLFGRIRNAAVSIGERLGRIRDRIIPGRHVEDEEPAPERLRTPGTLEAPEEGEEGERPPAYLLRTKYLEDGRRRAVDEIAGQIAEENGREEPNAKDKKEAETRVPTEKIMAAGPRVKDAIPRQEVKDGLDLALQKAEEAASEAEHDRLRKEARGEFKNLSENEQQDVVAEAARQVSRDTMEAAMAADNPAEYLQENHRDLLRAIDEAHPNLEDISGRQELFHTYNNEMLQRLFDDDGWRANVYDKFLNPETADPALSPKERLEAVFNDRAVTPEGKVGAAMLLLAMESDEYKAAASDDAREAILFKHMLKNAAEIDNVDDLFRQLGRAGIVDNDDLLNQVKATVVVQDRINHFLTQGQEFAQYQLDNNPALNTLLNEITGSDPLDADAVRALAAVDFLFDITDERYSGMGFNPDGELRLPTDHMHFGMSKWLQENLGEPGIGLLNRKTRKNPELTEAIEHIMLQRMYGEDYEDRIIIPDDAYLSERRGLNRSPSEWKEVAKGGENAEMIAVLTSELGMTVEQARAVLQTSETNLMKDLLNEGGKVMKRVLRGGAIAVGMGVAASVSPAVAGVFGIAMGAYGVYNAVKFATGAIGGVFRGARGTVYRRWDGAAVNHMGERAWNRDQQYFAREGQDRQRKRFFGRQTRRMGHVLGQFWRPNVAAGVGGALVGGGVAYMAGPASVLFQPLVIMGAKTAEVVGKKRQRDRINAVVEQLRENPRENMQALLAQIQEEAGGISDEEARERLRNDLVGAAEKYQQIGNRWSSFTTGYMMGNSVGALAMRVTGAKTGFERLQDRFGGGDGVDGGDKGDGGKGEPDEPRPRRPKPPEEPPITPRPDNMNTAGDIMRGWIGPAGESGIDTMELWDRGTWGEWYNNLTEAQRLKLGLDNTGMTGAEVVANLNSASQSELNAMWSDPAIRDAALQAYGLKGGGGGVTR